MHKTWISLSILSLGAAALLCGCGHVPISPMAVSERIPLGATTTDLTGTSVDSLLAGSLETSLTRDFFYQITPVHPSGGARMYQLIVYQNPFCYSRDVAAAAVRVHGDLERADYGPLASDPLRVLGGFLLLGWLGATLAEEDPNAFIGALQYRFSLDYSGSNHSILVRVGRPADVRQVGRRLLMETVTTDATAAFLFQLVDRLHATDQLVVKRRESILPTEKMARKRVWEWTGAREP